MLRNLLLRYSQVANVCDQRVAMFVGHTTYDVGSVRSHADLTFSLQHIGTVSVLAACISFVSLFCVNQQGEQNEHLHSFNVQLHI